MKFSFNIGKQFGRLSPEQRRVVDRLKRGEITAEEAERELGAHVKEWHIKLDDDPEPSESSTDEAPRSDETPEEAKARELVERIARDVYLDTD